MAYTALNLIEDALKELASYSQGETLSDADAAHGLEFLNQMLDSWSTERLTVFNVVTRSHTLVIGTASYTVGPAGDVNVARPLQVLKAWIRDAATNPVDYPMVLLSQPEYNGIAVKGTTSTIPTGLFYDPEFPLGKLYYWPEPAAAYSGFFDAVEELTAFATLTTAFAFPPGYKRAMRTNLALELGPSFGREPSAFTYRAAAESKGNIKRVNRGNNPPAAALPAGLLRRPHGTYNVFRDW